MTAAKFAHVALNCRNMAATERFYTKHFGFKRARVFELGGDERIVFLRLGDMYLELFSTSEQPPVGTPEKDGFTWAGIRHIAFQVDDVDAKLQEMGDDASVSLGPFSFDAFIRGWKTAWLRDPDGNIVEITHGFVDQPASASPMVVSA